MTSTHEPPPGPTDSGSQADAPPNGASDPGPQLNRERLHDIDRVRRSSTDRYVAGVAGGLGRHFGIDPVILRVLFVVAAFFGGAGLVLYIACWLLVPEEGHERAALHTGADLRRVLLASIAVIAGIVFLGNAWGGFDWPVWPLCAAVILLVIVLANRREERRATSASTTASTATAPGTSPYEASVPPFRPVYQPVPRPRRTGMLLILPTLALIAVALGGLGIYAIDHPVAPGAWAALALTVIGAMLVVGAFVGRPGGLIALGVITVPILLATTLVGSGHWHEQEVRHTPVVAADVQSQYDDGNGRTVLDLSGVRDVAALDGRTIGVAIGAGELEVVLPPDVTADVDAHIRYAGGLTIDGRDTGGLNPSLRTTVAATSTPAATITLDLDARVGHIEITRS
jgi:phage shock protein PspC (stress-responsive transcriptional regulator)